MLCLKAHFDHILHVFHVYALQMHNSPKLMEIISLKPYFLVWRCFLWILYKCWRYKIVVKDHQHYASIAHPQANDQVEQANGLLLAGLKPRLYDELKDCGGKWIYELPKVSGDYALNRVERHGTHPSSWFMGQKPSYQ
jgi:ABC-type nickel/cobalt efflux system permease component RcnA